MIGNLNLMSEQELQDGLRGLRARLGVIERRQRSGGDPTGDPMFHLDAAVVGLDVVRLRYASGHPASDLRRPVAEAAGHYLRLFELRDLDLEALRRSRGQLVDSSIFRAERLYNATVAAVIVDLPEVLEALAAMPAATFSDEHPPRHGLYYGCSMVIMAAVLDPTSQARRELSDFGSRSAVAVGSAPAVVLEKLLPVAEGARAVLEGDARRLHAALRSVLEAHERLAQSDDGCRHPATLLSFDALALAALARRRGLDVLATSRYMPTDLIP